MSSVAFEIPTSPQNQKFAIFLGGNLYNISLRWNKFAQSWSMDVSDVNQNSLAQGLPLVTGADLLAQLDYLEIGDPGSQMIVQSDGIANTVPDSTSLGVTGHLYYNVSSVDAAGEVVST